MGPLIPCFGLLVTSALGFKARTDPFACFFTCVILRFTSGATPADCRGQHGSQSFLIPCTCRHVHKHWWRFGTQTHDCPCCTQQARHNIPLGKLLLLPREFSQHFKYKNLLVNSSAKNMRNFHADL